MAGCGKRKKKCLLTKLHSHDMVISSNAQTTNNSNGYIRTLFALANPQSTVLLDGSGNNSISGNGKWK